MKTHLPIPTVLQMYTIILVASVLCGALSNELSHAKGTARSDSVHFVFNPPTDRPYWIIVSHESFQNDGKRARESSEFTVRKVSVERDSSGFHLYFDPDSSVYLQNGEPVANALIEAAQSGRPVVHTDSVGTFLNVTSRLDPSELAEISSRMDTAIAGKMVEMGMPEFMRERQRLEWSFYYETFSGQTVALGDGYEFVGESPMPGGSMAMKTTILIDSIAPCTDTNDQSCVLIRYLTESSDAAGMKGSLQKLFQSEPNREKADSAISQMSGMSLTTYGEILMDPATMLILDEIQIKDITVASVDSSANAVSRHDSLHRYITFSEP